MDMEKKLSKFGTSIEQMLKNLDKAVKKHDIDAKYLKELIQDSKAKDKNLHSIICRMTVRAETIQQYLRTLGRMID